MPIKYAFNEKAPTCLHILGQSLVEACHKESRELLMALTKLTHDCMASDFNEHWDSFKEAEKLIKPKA